MAKWIYESCIGRHHIHPTRLIRSIQNEQGVNKVVIEQLEIGHEEVVPEKKVRKIS